MRSRQIPMTRNTCSSRREKSRLSVFRLFLSFWCKRPMLIGSCEHAEGLWYFEASVVLASASFWSTLVLRGKQSSRLWWLSRGPSSFACLRRLSEEFPFLCLRSRCSHLEIWCLISSSSYQAVLCPVFGRCMWSTELDFSGHARFFGGQCLARQWIHVLHQYLALLDEFCTCSTVKWTRILRCQSPFSRRVEKCAQPMLQLSVLVCELALGNPDITSEVHVAGMCDDGEHFFAAFWQHSSCLRARVQNNNNNTIWGGSVLIGEEPPPHSGELKHALSQAGGPTQSQLSRLMS